MVMLEIQSTITGNMDQNHDTPTRITRTTVMPDKPTLSMHSQTITRTENIAVFTTTVALVRNSLIKSL